MSVEAINAAEPQQRRNNPMGTAAAVGAGTGLVGAGATYFATGGKNIPTLEKVLEQDTVTFTKTMDKAKEAGKEEAEITKVKDAYNNVKSKVAKEQTIYDTAKGEVEKAYKKMTDAPGDTTIKDARQKIDERKAKEVEVKKFNENGEVIDGETKKIKVSEMQQELEDLEKDIKDPTKAADKTKNEAKLKALQNEYKTELDALKADEKLKAYEKTLDEAQKARFEKLAENDGEEKELKNALTEAEKNLKEARKKAIGELGDDAKNAFGKIKGALKEIKWGKIGLWGGVAAAVGLIAGYMLGNNKQA